MKVLRFRECPDCGRISPYIQSSCACGYRFTGGEQMYKTCPYCGSLNPSSRIFCDCGRFVLFLRSKITETDIENAYHSGLFDGAAREQQQHDSELEEFFQTAQLKDTFTGQPIQSLEDYQRWRNTFECAKAERKSGQVQREKVYLMEDKDGFVVRVPESKLEAWKRAQQDPPRPLNKAERQLVDRIMESIYGPKEGEDEK